MKFKIAFIRAIIAICLLLSNYSSCISFKIEQKAPWDYIKSMGFRCISETGLATAIRLNSSNDIECWSENGKECVWGLNTDEKCLEVIQKKNLSKLQLLVCGMAHKKIFGISGYERKGHWCKRGLTFYFEEYHCPSKTNIKVAFKMNKLTGEIECLSEDYKTCYKGKDLEKMCAETNDCKKQKNDMKKRVLIQSKDGNNTPMGKIGCQTTLVEQKGRSGYIEAGEHWCKKSLSYFRYNGQWEKASQTGLDQIVRLSKTGNIECLSKDDKSCVQVKGGDSAMEKIIYDLTNGGQNDTPKSVECKTSDFENKKHWCYKAQFPILGSSAPSKIDENDLKPKPKPKKEGKKKDTNKTKDDKKKDEEELKVPPMKIDPEKDFKWRDTIFGPEKNGFNKDDDISTNWRAQPVTKPDDPIKEEKGPAAKANEVAIKNPGWRNLSDEQLGLKPAIKPKKEEVVGETWRNGSYKTDDLKLDQQKNEEKKKEEEAKKKEKEKQNPKDRWRDSEEMYQPNPFKDEKEKTQEEPKPKEGYKGKWEPLMKNIEILTKKGDQLNNGDQIKIKHVLTRNTLHSHEINYNGGSRQQEVTGFWGNDDNDWWVIKGGNKIKSGDIVVLTHLKTGRNLHSHNILASVSTQQQEVSAYGQNGKGDNNDRWRIVMTQSYIWENDQWKVGDIIRFVHVNTGAFLHSHNIKLKTGSKQQEVTGFKGDDMNNDWVVTEKKVLK